MENTRIDLLNRELLASSLVNEITRTMLSAEDLEQAIEAFLLGVGEIIGCRSLALYRVDGPAFKLRFWKGLGPRREALERLEPPMHLPRSAYADALFRKRHIICETPEANDPFGELGVAGYIAVPILSRSLLPGPTQSRPQSEGDCLCSDASAHESHPQSHHCHLESSVAPDSEFSRRYCAGCSEYPCQAMLWMETDGNYPQSANDRIMHLVTLVGQAGMVMENFRMRSDLEKANESMAEANGKLELANRELMRMNGSLDRLNRKMEGELEQARQIQKNLLPQQFPRELLKDIVVRYAPASQVGGDYYDCFRLSDNRLGFVIADVSGHGLGAALIMSMFKALLKTFSRSSPSPADALLEINRTFMREVRGPYFVTAFYAIFDPLTRRLTYCNAGHPAQWLIEEGRIPRELPSAGLLLGVFDDPMLEDVHVQLASPSRLTLYTDGVIEAQDEKTRMFGMENFRNLLADPTKVNAKELLDRVISALNGYTSSPETADDITLVILDL